jgi:hypothetical protein
MIHNRNINFGWSHKSMEFLIQVLLKLLSINNIICLLLFLKIHKFWFMILSKTKYLKKFNQIIINPNLFITIYLKIKVKIIF